MDYCPERVKNTSWLSFQMCENIIKYLRKDYLVVSISLRPCGIQKTGSWKNNVPSVWEV